MLVCSSYRAYCASADSEHRAADCPIEFVQQFYQIQSKQQLQEAFKNHKKNGNKAVGVSESEERNQIIALETASKHLTEKELDEVFKDLKHLSSDKTEFSWRQWRQTTLNKFSASGIKDAAKNETELGH